MIAQIEVGDALLEKEGGWFGGFYSEEKNLGSVCQAVAGSWSVAYSVGLKGLLSWQAEY